MKRIRLRSTPDDEGKDHLVLTSGGLGSWGAGKRVARWHGTERTKLVFTDTRIEDEDLYRFLPQAAANIGASLISLADGRDPWQVFEDVRFIGNTRADPCSAVLKRDLFWDWIECRYQPDDVVVHFGIDWSESHRIERTRKARPGWDIRAPLCAKPYLSKDDLISWAEAEGLLIPRLYRMGMAHNNCGGFCVKQGQGGFITLLEQLPERYREHEKREWHVSRTVLGGDYAILRDRTRDGIAAYYSLDLSEYEKVDGKLLHRDSGEPFPGVRPLTLRELRHRHQGPDPDEQCSLPCCRDSFRPEVDRYDIGGCGCALD